MAKLRILKIRGTTDEGLRAGKEHGVNLTYLSEDRGPTGESAVCNDWQTDADLDALTRWYDETKNKFPSPVGALIKIDEVKPSKA